MLTAEGFLGGNRLSYAFGICLRIFVSIFFYSHFLPAGFHPPAVCVSAEMRQAASRLICTLNLSDTGIQKMFSCNLIHMGRDVIRTLGATQLPNSPALYNLLVHLLHMHMGSTPTPKSDCFSFSLGVYVKSLWEFGQVDVTGGRRCGLNVERFSVDCLLFWLSSQQTLDAFVGP